LTNPLRNQHNREPSLWQFALREDIAVWQFALRRHRRVAVRFTKTSPCGSSLYKDIAVWQFALRRHRSVAVRFTKTSQCGSSLYEDIAVWQFAYKDIAVSVLAIQRALVHAILTRFASTDQKISFHCSDFNHHLRGVYRTRAHSFRLVKQV
jgi:hypothetical protein